jgi:stage II sporulation protein D (peptidoglycan lytic transglycosylase)
MIVLATLALPFLAALTVHGPDTISISLFTLFKPEAIQVRIASGDGANLDAAGFGGNRSMARGEFIRIRLSGNQLNLVIAGSRGTIQQSVVAGAVRIVPDDSATLELILPGKIKRVVRGTVSVDAGIGGHGPMRIRLTTSREGAVASVVAAETSRRERAALMAIAVVVRTFMLSHAGRHSSEGFDFCDTTHCQLYRGEQDLSDRVASAAVLEAVARTAGQVLSFKGRPVEGYYTAACGGLSATPSMVWGGSTGYPYRRIPCRWCQHSRMNKWERSADADRVLDSLSALIASKLSRATQLIIVSDQGSGFVQSVTVRDESKRVVLSTDAFRRAIGLSLGWSTVLSPTFTVERRGSRFIFRGRGFGSQVGLCEEGAAAQASAGRAYREILSFYYPGADISERATHE